MNTKLRILILSIIGIVGYGVWAVMAYFDPSQRADFLKLNMAMVAGTIGLVLRDMPTAIDNPPSVTPTEKAPQ